MFDELAGKIGKQVKASKGSLGKFKYDKDEEQPADCRSKDSPRLLRPLRRGFQKAEDFFKTPANSCEHRLMDSSHCAGLKNP